MWRFFCGLLVLFHWSICLFCQYLSLDYCSFLISSEMEKYYSSYFVFLFQFFFCSYKFEGKLFCVCRIGCWNFFFFYCSVAYGIPGPGIRSDHNHDLCYSCSNAGSFNPLCWARIKPSSWCCRDATDPVVPQQELPLSVLDSYIWGLSCLGVYMFTVFLINWLYVGHVWGMWKLLGQGQTQAVAATWATAVATLDP